MRATPTSSVSRLTVPPAGSAVGLGFQQTAERKAGKDRVHVDITSPQADPSRKPQRCTDAPGAHGKPDKQVVVRPAHLTRFGCDHVVPDGRPARGRQDHKSPATRQ